MGDFWSKKIGDRTVTAVKLEPSFGRDPRPTAYQVLLTGSNGVKRLIGRMDAQGWYDHALWDGEPAVDPEDPAVVGAIEELREFVAVDAVMCD